MSRRNETSDLSDYEVAYGVDDTSPLVNMKPGYARRALNCNLGLVSGWIRRGGFTSMLTSTWDERSITGGVEFRKSDGSLITVLYGVDDTDGALGFVGAGGASVTEIDDGFSDTARPAFAQFKGRLFMLNGDDDGVLYDGTSLRQIGIDAPTNAPSGTAASSGSLNAGNYVAAYTYYNSVTKAESSPSPLSDAVTATADQKITWSLTAGDSDTADTIRIWRTAANGDQLFLDGTAAIGATSYESTKHDDELGRPLELDNSRLSDVTTSKGKFPVVAQSRVFVVTGRNEVRYSKLGFDGPMPESFEAKAVVDTTGTLGDSDDIVGLGTIGDLVIVVKRHSIGRLEPLTLPILNDAFDSQLYRYIEVSVNAGGLSHFAGGQVNGEYVWATRDNVYATNGQQVRPIAPTRQAFLRACGFGSSQLEKISFGNDSKHARIYIQLFDDAADSVPTLTLVGDYQQMQGGVANYRWTDYGPGPDDTNYPGIQAGCFIQVTNTTDGSFDMLFGNTAGDGQLYRMNSGDNDGDAANYFQIITRPYHLSRPQNVKLFKDFGIEAQGSGDDYRLTVAPLFDLSATRGFSENRVLSQQIGAKWDESAWDEAEWADDSAVNIEYNAHRKARFMQVIMEQGDRDAPVTVYGWGPSAVMYRRS